MTTREDIQRFSARLVREYQPRRVILFGSHARGEAHPDSDVDLLVVMPHDGKGWRAAAEMRTRLSPPFPLDLLVRSPDEIEQRLRLGDDFVREILTEGRVLYDAADG